MGWTDKILEWTAWADERLRDFNELPTPGSLPGREPWFDDFLELLGEDGPPKELQESFQSVIRDLRSFAPRFVGLDLFYKLQHQDPYPLQEELLSDARASAGAAYRSLVVAVAPADVPLEKRQIDWELRLSSLLRMWERADSLIERLGQCTGVLTADAQAVRAQHLFWRRYLPTESGADDSVADLLWFAHPIGEEDKFASALVSISVLSRPGTTIPSDAPTAESVYGEVVRSEWPQVRWLKSMMLARLEVDLDMRRESITTLETVLADDVCPRPMRTLIYEALGDLYGQLGDTRATEKFLYAWSFEFPNEPKVLMKLATVAADSTQYEKAYRFLKEAVALNPDLEREPGARIGLAFGNIAEDLSSTSDVRDALARHPDIQRALDAAISLYWGDFSQLDDAERLEWAVAIYAMRVLTVEQPSFSPVWSRKAATGFLTIVEMQLRRRVFEPIADAALLDREVAATAMGVQHGDRQWILAQYLQKKGHLALGQMLRILDRCQKGHRRLTGLDAFVWARVQGSPVLRHLDALQRMNEPRNEGVHNLGPMEAGAAHADARLLIEACVEHSRRLQS